MMKEHILSFGNLVNIFIKPQISALAVLLTLNIMTPLVLLFFFRTIFELDATRLTYILTGIMLSGSIATGIMSISSKINNLSVSDGLEYFLMLPINKYTFVFSMLTSELIVYLPTTILLITILRYVFGFSIDIDAVLLIYLLLMSISVICIGCIIGNKSRSHYEANVYSQVFSYFLLFMSPVYYCIEKLPTLLRVVAYFLPTTYAVRLVRNSLFENSVYYDGKTADIIVLIMFGLISIFVLGKIFKWNL